MRHFADIADLRAAKGQVIGTSDWVTVTQEIINQFAEISDDHQWIHVDPERAKAAGFGGSVAHGLLVMSLFTRMTKSIWSISNVSHKVAYGLNRLRWISPVLGGDRIRMTMKLLDVVDMANGMSRMEVEFTFEREGGTKPACIAEMLTCLQPA